MQKMIEVESLSKIYRLGKIGTGSLRQDLHGWWQKNILKKQSNFFQGIGVDGVDYIRALHDVSFSINEGDTCGIIGRNGAGKSTLLKILSRIVKPSSGSISGRGRVSSLLEIGTGFHSELTGKENIFISGYMLGMNKREIRAKYDEIVAFSGVEKFLDTPVKRYSSGMYVRLAFSVAAHLEPDILIVDEVLAVGDVEFQKKCLGKMKDASRERGRTVLFVSHNMQAVNQLCNRSLWLEKGELVMDGNSAQVINAYLAENSRHVLHQEWKDIDTAPGNDQLRVLKVELVPHYLQGQDVIDIRTPLSVHFSFLNRLTEDKLVAELLLFNVSGECIFAITSRPAYYENGIIQGCLEVPGNFLNDGSYYFTLAFFRSNKVTVGYFDEVLHFSVNDYADDRDWYVKWWGHVRPDFPLTLKQA